MRPLGEVAHALMAAAATPGTVRDVCERAQVGYDVGRYTASRLIQRGWLRQAAPADDVAEPVRSGPGRPAAVVVAAQPPAEGDEAPHVMVIDCFRLWA